MKKLLLSLVFIVVTSLNLLAQVAGDTIVVNSIHYATRNRDTMVNFPNNPNLQFEKILMLYNMRCKGGVVGNQVPPAGLLGCGEWDYSCNTYVRDSTRLDSIKATHPSHIIPGFTGTTFNYTNNPTYTYYQYNQQQVVYNSVVSEMVSTVGSGTSTSSSPFLGQMKAAKSQFLWKASELTAAGVTAGNITSIRLNVNTLGSGAKFLKVRMKHTTKDSLKANNPDLTGFTEVYFLNTNLVNGMNHLNFYNNFSWNGTDNLLVEFSFTNDASGSNTLCTSDVTPQVTGLVSATNDYAVEFNGGSLIKLGNTNLSNIGNEVSVSFWCNGDPNVLPKNTSIVHAANANNLRELNVHLPWSNSRIYWDCGNSAGNDRIDQLATNNQFKGEWNYYVFTKNVTTGVMNIYLNGVLWHTGTGKTIPIQLTDFVIGAGNQLVNPYFGKIDDFTLWNTALNAATVQDWMYKKITPTHPNYANLLAHYNLNEGTGNSILDASAVATSSTVNGLANWYFFKGKDIFKNFEETNNRPAVSFVQGVYTQTTTPIIVMDSVEKYKNTVYRYIVNGNQIAPFDTNYYYQAGYSYIYDGDNNTLLDSVLNSTQNSITISNLSYFALSPADFQIMSFVTPYGNGLNLGVDGKTWTFDMTDFAPILKGNKRMFLNAGGQLQEDMDIKFLFIVGTPPKNVLDINNIWKVESVTNANILNDLRFEPRSFPIKATTSSAKIRTMITGHGQEGEFIPRVHEINVNGGVPEFSWNVWKRCGENPVYPQGGTWIYDRAGWCPGMATDLIESNITSYITAGQSIGLDYNMAAATGDSRYWVSHQLVEYGAPNFTVDAAIVDIKNPTNKVEYARTNPFCKDPLVVIRNTGSAPLTSLKIEYWINNWATKAVYNWTGNLNFLEEAEVSLPNLIDIYQAVNAPTGNIFNVQVSNPNGQQDAYEHNNKMNSTFNVSNVVPMEFVIWLRTNNNGFETQYKITDQNNNIVFSKTGLTNATNYLDTLNLPFGCYTLEVEDSGEDGLSFWANTTAGSGWVRIRRPNGSTIAILNPDFGTSTKYSFTVEYALSNLDLKIEEEILIYPNPTEDIFTVQGKDMQDKKIFIYSTVGQEIKLPVTYESDKVNFNAAGISSGIYQLLIIDKEGRKLSKKIVIE